MAQKEFKQIFPKAGWVEHDADEIWAGMLGVAVEAMNMIGAAANDIAAIGITNQRETTIVWDKATGIPVYNAIVWQCRRTSDYCDSLKAKGLTDTIQKKTGLVIDAYFSAIINAPVERPSCVETTAMGAAYLAGLAVGYWSDKEDVVKNRGVDRVFEPKMDQAIREKKIAGWEKAVKYSFGWAKDE